MKFTATLVLFAGAVMAIPTDGKGGGGGGSSYQPCPNGLFSNAQCCATDVLGVVGLDCQNPSNVPFSASAFRSDCASKGQQARCCVLPAAGQAVLCQTPVGV